MPIVVVAVLAVECPAVLVEAVAVECPVVWVAAVLIAELAAAECRVAVSVAEHQSSVAIDRKFQ